jgi:hypothetical protein
MGTKVDIKEISTGDLLESIERFGGGYGEIGEGEGAMDTIRDMGRDQIEKIYKSIMGGTKLTKKKSKSTKVATAKQGGIIKMSSGGAAKRGYGKARR